MTPETKVNILLLLWNCPQKQENSPQNRSNVAIIKKKTDLVTASETKIVKHQIST